MKKKKLCGVIAMVLACSAISAASFTGCVIDVPNPDPSDQTQTLKYSVTFTTGEESATGSMAAQEVDANAEFTVPENTLTVAGKSFVYYLNGTAQVKPGDKITVTKDIALVAVFKAVEFKVTFAAPDGATGSMAAEDVAEGATYTVPANAYAVEGKIFSHFTDGSKTYKPGEKFTVSGNVTLTAVFAEAPVVVADKKVTFVAPEEATGTMAEETVSEGASFTVPANAFAVEGKVFAYYLKGTDKVYPGDKITVSDNVTLTAVFAEADKTVSFACDEEGATGSMAAEQVAYEGKFTVPASEFAVAGKTFAYYLNGADKVYPGDKITVTENVELKAVFADVVYTVTYKVPGESDKVQTVIANEGADYTTASFVGSIPENKRFKGWSADGGSTVVAEGAKFAVTENVVLEPVFVMNWIGTFSYEINTSKMNVTVWDNGDGMSAVISSSGKFKASDIITATENGSRLEFSNGYVIIEDNGALKITDEDTFDRPVTKTSSAATVYSVTFNDELGDVFDSYFVTEAGKENVTAPEYSVDEAEYTFGGWQVKDGETVYQIGDKISFTTNDIELSPIVNEIKFSVTFSAPEGVTGEMETASVKAGAEYTVPANAFEKEGLTFAYFVDGSGNRVEAGAKLTVSADLTLTPVFAYTVSYDGVAETVIEADAANYVVKAYTGTPEAGKAFDCWLNGEAEVEAGAKLALTQNLTLTAKMGDAVVVTFAGEGEETETLTVVKGKEFAVPVANLVNGEYKILSYTYGDGLTVKPGATLTLDEATTLTAVWGYTVTYAGGQTVEVSAADAATYTFAEYDGEVPYGKIFKGWTDGTTVYQAGSTTALGMSLEVEAVWDIIMAPVAGTTYRYAGGSGYIKFNADGTVYYAFHIKDADFSITDYDSITWASDYELLHPFDGLMLEYRFQYNSSQPLQFVKITIKNGIAVAEIRAEREEEEPRAVFTLAQGDKTEYTVDGNKFVAIKSDDYVNYFWNAAGTTEYKLVTLSGEEKEGNVVKVLDGTTEVAEIQFTKTGIRTIGAEAGKVVAGYTLDGWGNATKEGETVSYTVSDKYIVINGQGYTLDYVAVEGDIQGTFVYDGGTQTWTVILDGYGTATTIYQYGTGTPSSLVSTYTYNDQTGKVVIKSTANYSIPTDYTVSENNNILTANKYGTDYIFAKEGYVSPDQVDSKISGIHWTTSNGLKLTINAETNKITIDFGEDYDGDYTYTENYNGSILSFVVNDATWKLTVKSTSELSLAYGSSTVTLKEAVNVVLKAEGAEDVTVSSIAGEKMIPDYNAFTVAGKRIIGWTNGDTTYTVGEEVTVAAGLELTAVFADYSIDSFVGEWLKVSTSKSVALTVAKGADGAADSITFTSADYETQYCATDGNTLIVVVKYHYYGSTYYNYVYKLTVDDVDNTKAAFTYTQYSSEKTEAVYQGDYSNIAQSAIDGKTYYVFAIGERTFVNFLTSSTSDYVLAEVSGTEEAGEEVTYTATIEGTEVTKTVKYSEGTNNLLALAFKGTEAGAVIDGYTLDGYGATNDESVTYVINKAGVLVMSTGKGYKSVDGEYVEQAKDEYAGTYDNAYKSSTYYYWYILDGFGGAEYYSEYVSTQSVSVTKCTYTVDANGNITMADGKTDVLTSIGNNLYLHKYSSSTTYIYGKTVENAEAFEEGTYKSGALTVVVNADQTITISGASYASMNGTVAYTQGSGAYASFTQDGKYLYFGISGNKMYMSLNSGSYSTTFYTLDKEVDGPVDPSEKDGWEGVYTYARGTVTVYGDGTAEWSGTALTYTVQDANTLKFSNDYYLIKSGDTYKIADDDAYPDYEAPATREDLPVEVELDGWQGTYAVLDEYGEDLDFNIVINGDGTCTVDGVNETYVVSGSSLLIGDQDDDGYRLELSGTRYSLYDVYEHETRTVIKQ